MRIHITKFGAKIRVKDGLFEVRSYHNNGQLFKQQFAPSHIDSIWMYKDTSISVAVMILAEKHQIEVVFIGERFQPIGRFLPLSNHSSSKVIRAQSFICTQPNIYFSFVKAWIFNKMENQVTTLAAIQLSVTKESQRYYYIDQQIQKLVAIQEEWNRHQFEPMDGQQLKNTIRGYEGSSARIFFTTISKLLPVAYRFAKRSRRPAEDIFNALLNYSFAVLYSMVERALLNAGLNPYLGYFHRDDYQHKGLVYDFIEPYRIDIIMLVFQLLKSKALDEEEDIDILSAQISIRQKGRKKNDYSH